ncbi:MAG: phosphoribosylanthranilate isomerase [Prevotellaceae bacterium]|nr:phosphoribosylanthranilate isomerase [Prevotellaceae bacterium]
MKIKVCGMKEARNIAEIAQLQPDYMGFIFYDRSPRFAEELPPEALEVLSPKTQRVGVFVNATREYIRRQAARYRLDLLQLHGDETPAECAYLKQSGYNIIKAFGIQSAADIEAMRSYEEMCSYFLLDTKTAQRGGSGEKFDYRLLANNHSKTPFFLSGGIAPEDAVSLTALQLPCCKAIDINSRFELLPGVKNVVEVGKFIEAIRGI